MCGTGGVKNARGISVLNIHGEFRWEKRALVRQKTVANGQGTVGTSGQAKSHMATATRVGSPSKIVLIRDYACTDVAPADFMLKSTALINTNPTERPQHLPAALGQQWSRTARC